MWAPLRPPYLKLGRGRVLTALGRAAVRLSGPAVQVGIPFSGERVGFTVQWYTEEGRPVPAVPSWVSEDLRWRGGCLRLCRPVPTPRLWISAAIVVGFKLRRFQGKTRRDTVRGLRVGYTRVCTKAGRLLWQTTDNWPAAMHVTWDGRHAWRLASNDAAELRRLADGAVMMRVPRRSLSLNREGHPLARFGECQLYCPWRCCYKDVVTGLARQVAPLLGSCTWSPTGDRLVHVIGGNRRPFEFHLYLRSEGFAVPHRLLDVPVASDQFYVSAAGELVFFPRGGGVVVWRDGETTTVLPRDGRTLHLTPARSNSRYAAVTDNSARTQLCCVAVGPKPVPFPRRRAPPPPPPPCK